MSAATRVLSKPKHSRRQDAIELYYGEFDSTYFHGVNDSSLTRILRETEPKAPFPDREGGPPVTRPLYETALGVIGQIAGAVSQAVQSVSNTGGSTSTRGGSYGAQPSDYYVR